jgi:MEMO1 family protein
MSVRPTAVENQFYPGDRNRILAQIDEYFTRAGGLPTTFDDPPVTGVVVPHAGYMYSGPTAARSYRALARGFNNVDVFILLGPSHTGLGHKISVSKMDFDTPLGVVENDTELADLMLKRSSIIRHSEEAHILEHSIEVQLPFLQYIARTAGTDFKILPIAMMTQNIQHAKAVGRAIHDAQKESGKRICVIASSDFTHGGAGYGFIPCPRNQLVDWMHDHDGTALKMISQLDIDGFFEHKAKYKLTICGSGPIGALLEYANLAGAESGKILQYATSYDVSRNTRQVCGYGSVVIE